MSLSISRRHPSRSELFEPLYVKDKDDGAAYLDLADRAICIGEAAPRDSYLRAERIIAAAEVTRSDAIHPGYGFMAENADFAEMCHKNDIEFIGPPVSSMKLMGSKIDSKKSMMKVGVYVVPGVTEAISDHEKAKDIAHEIGYPEC